MTANTLLEASINGSMMRASSPKVPSSSMAAFPTYGELGVPSVRVPFLIQIYLAFKTISELVF